MPRTPHLARLLVMALALVIAAVKAASCGGRTACFTVPTWISGPAVPLPGVDQQQPS